MILAPKKKSLNTKLLQKHQYLNKSRVSNKGHPLFIHYLSLIIYIFFISGLQLTLIFIIDLSVGHFLD